MKFSRFHLVEQWFRVMVQRGVHLNVQHYNVMISACGRAGDAERAELWLRRLQAEADETQAECLEPHVSLVHHRRQGLCVAWQVAGH